MRGPHQKEWLHTSSTGRRGLCRQIAQISTAVALSTAPGRPAIRGVWARAFFLLFRGAVRVAYLAACGKAGRGECGEPTTAQTNGI